MLELKNKLNLISLIIIQASNAIIPLIVFPFVLKQIGSEAYSEIVTAESIMFIIYTCSLYSFEINGVSNVVMSRNEVRNISLGKIFINIFFIRFFILSIISTIIFCFFLIYKKSCVILLLLWLLYPLSFILQSSYFYQGLEKNTTLAWFVLTSRISTVLCLFYFISDSSDIFLVPLLIGATYMIAGILSFFYIFKKYSVTVSLIDFSYMKELVKDGKEIFFGNASVILFRGSNVLLLGMITNDATAISSYSIAEKFIKSLQAAMRPLNQYYFPKAIVLLQRKIYPDKFSLKGIFRLSIIQLLSLMSIILLLIIFYYYDIFNMVRKYPHIDDIVIVVSIMLPAVFIGILNFMYGSVGLNLLNRKSYYAKSIFLTGVLSFVISILLISILNDNGAALSYLISECLLLLFILSQYVKKTH